MEDNKTRYNRVIAYIRKSSEDNDKGEAHKQLNSIKYQRQFIKDEIMRLDLKLIHPPFEDDKTGYEAYVRPGFREMIRFLDKHPDDIDGIVCTEISRLARNFGDGGKILWLIQKGVIKRIYSHSKIFTDSSSDQLMVAIEFAMSKKSSDEGSYRTKSGMKAKAQNLKHPARPAILGYITQGPEGAKKWIIDPVNGPLVKRVFEHFSLGKYTYQEIAEYAYQIGLRSKYKKSINGKISKNTWQNRLRDKKYTGIFEHEGERIAGNYEPLISHELFYDVQEVMSNNEHPKETHIDYAYSGIVKCGLCGGMLSGTNKKGITYYRCGKRKSPCKNMSRIAYVPESIMEDYLMKAFESIEIDEEAWREAKDYVIELNQPQRVDLKKQINILNEQIEAEKVMQTNLGRKFGNGELSKFQYDRLIEDSYQKEASLRKTIIRCQNIIHELEELMYQFLDNIKYITKRIRIALPANKREMVDIFCENLVWEDNKLRWDWKKPYFIFAKQSKSSTMLPDLDSNQEPTA